MSQVHFPGSVAKIVCSRGYKFCARVFVAAICGGGQASRRSSMKAVSSNLGVQNDLPVLAAGGAGDMLAGAFKALARVGFLPVTFGDLSRGAPRLQCARRRWRGGRTP
jgi:hypothetical protein